MSIDLRWREESIARDHDRNSFDCGEPDLNTYLRRFARQNHENGGSKTFVAVSLEDERTILGYYSLSPASISFQRAPEAVTQGLGRYEIPGFRLGRLAVDSRSQGRGLGGQLLISAGRRCLRVAAEVGGVILIIDAKNERVAAWYAGYGAIALLDDPLTLVLPLKTIGEAIDATS